MLQVNRRSDLQKIFSMKSRLPHTLRLKCSFPTFCLLITHDKGYHMHLKCSFPTFCLILFYQHDVPLSCHLNICVTTCTLPKLLFLKPCSIQKINPIFKLKDIVSIPIHMSALQFSKGVINRLVLYTTWQELFVKLQLFIFPTHIVYETYSGKIFNTFYFLLECHLTL